MLIYVCSGDYEPEGEIIEEGNLTHTSFKLALEVGKTIRKKYGVVSKFITSPYLQARETTKALKEACRKKGEHPVIEVNVELSKRIPPSMEGRLELTEKTMSYNPPLFETKEEFCQRVEKQYKNAKKELHYDEGLVVYITHPDFLSIITKKPKCDISIQDFLVLKLDSSSDSSSDDECESMPCRKKEKKCGCNKPCNCQPKCKCEVKCKCVKKCKCEKKCRCQEWISPYPPGCAPPCPPPCPQPFPFPCPSPCPPCSSKCPQPCPPCMPPCPQPCPPQPCPPVTVCVQYQQPPCNILKGACPDSPFIKKTLGGKTCCYCYQISCVCR